MATIMMCTGKKKNVKAIQDVFNGFQKKQQIQILASRQITKRVAFWNYEELKILYKGKEGRSLDINRGLIKNLDVFIIRERGNIIANAVTVTTEDNWLKFNLLRISAAFRRGGGHFQIQEHVDRKRPERIKRHCTLSINGPVGQVFTVIDKLTEEKILEDKSVEYVI